MYCQPILNKKNIVSGVEIFPKIKDGSMGYSKLMSLNASFNQVLSISESFLRYALEYANFWHKSIDYNIVVSIKLSNSELSNKNYPEMLNNLLSQYNYPANLLCLELSEAEAYSEKAVVFLKKITTMGVCTSLGNFGIGVSSFGLLRKINVNKISIPEVFTRDIENSEEAKQLIISIIRLAHSMGLSVLAKGVKRKEDMDFLTTLNCNEIQGSLICPIIDSSEMLKFIHNYNPDEIKKSDENKKNMISTEKLLKVLKDIKKANLFNDTKDENSLSDKKYICHRVNGELQLTPIKDLVYFQANGKKVTLSYNRGKKKVHLEGSLEVIKNSLSKHFIWLNKNTLINKNRLKK